VLNRARNADGDVQIRRYDLGKQLTKAVLYGG
jgi:hypothetical protein